MANVAQSLVVLETMPDHLRASHRAAGNWGRYPHNGAERRVATREEAESAVAADLDGYDRIVEGCPRYRVEVRGTFSGSFGGWRPAITGTLNQTGGSDEEASSTPSADEAAEYAELVIENGALREDVRIVEIAI